MANDKKNRRNFLIGVTGVLGGVSSVLAAVPFASSLRPSRKAQAEGAPVKINIEGGVKPGELRTAVWRLKPVWVFGRDREMIDLANNEKNGLADPDSDGSLQPEYCKMRPAPLSRRYLSPWAYVRIWDARPAKTETKGLCALVTGHGLTFPGGLLKAVRLRKI